MATPTPMKHAPSMQGRTPSQQGRTPSQQGRTPSQLAAATPPVSTPFSNPAHAAFSPRGPRSSPQQVKKSPATSVSLVGQTVNGALNFDSPSTAAAMGALGIGGGLDMGGLDQVAVGGLGGLGGLAGEDDKLKRLEAILDILNKKKGLVSQAGLERLAQRIGLETLNEEHTTPGGRKTNTLILAGSVTSLEIVLDNNIVQNISLGFPGSAPSVAKHMDPASQILLKDLQLLPHQSPLTKTLDRFAANLERLVSLDRLSILPALDCREALAGIYISLEKLYEWDLSRLREEPEMAGKSDQFLSLVVMCSRHGYPVMHTRDRVGLTIQYWQELRLIPLSSDKTIAAAQGQEKIWSLLIGCAPTDGIAVPPVRVSEDWMSKDIAKEDPLEPKKMVVDWQEPANVALPPSEDSKDAGVEMLQPDLSTTRVPQVMFTVTFDPPVILPQNDYMRLYAYANVNAPNMFGYPPTFDSLFFPIPPGTNQDPSELRTITRRRDVRVFDRDGRPATKAHRNTLFIYKQIYSQVVTEMPFSHPRQLVDMLPLLRQYAFLSTLLENSFGSKTRDALLSTAEDKGQASSRSTRTTTTKDELAAFMQSAQPKSSAESTAAAEGSLNLDVTLWVHPTPHLQVVFPFRDATVNVGLQILENAVVAVTNENILPQNDPTGGDADGEDASKGKGKGKMLTRAELGKVLEYMEDLCKWAEWLRTRLS